METRMMRYFLAVAQEGNITKAAGKLHITQPTLSRQMKDLEEQLGARLFERGKRQVTLTSAGIRFQQHAKAMLQLLDDALLDLKNTEQGLTGILSVGCVETAITPCISQWLYEFQQIYPGVRFSMYDAYSDDIKNRLDQNTLELGFLVEPVEAAKYHFYKINKPDRWGLVVSSAHPLSKLAAITKSIQLSDIELILPARNIVRDDLADQLHLNDGDLNIIGCTNLSSNFYPLIASGEAGMLTLEGSFNLRNQRNVAFIPLEPEISHQHVMVWRKNVVLSPVASKFVAFVQNKTMLYPEN